jgi:uncharacterized protein
MTAKFRNVFGAGKPVIAMVHLGALPGSPLHAATLDELVEGAGRDLAALQAAGFDAVMFGNENDRPYEFKVDTASTATMAYVIGRLRPQISVPFGVNVLWDPMASIALAAATGATFVREIMTGTHASDMGAWTPDAGAAMRYRDRLTAVHCPTAPAAPCSRRSPTRCSFREPSRARLPSFPIWRPSRRCCPTRPC